MKHLPTSRQLRYLAALYECGHFGSAAEICHVSQPAFSIAIRELESLLGLQLVDRTNRKVTFTSTGREIAIQAKLILQDIEILVDTAASSQAPLSGRLRLGAIPTIAPFVFPRVLPGLRKQYPQLKLYLHEGLTQEIHSLLMEGDLDVILVALPYELPGTENLQLCHDQFYLAYRQKTRLLKPGEHAVEKLPVGSVLLLQDGHCLRDHALSACKIRNRDKLSEITASSLLTLIQMVDADIGVTYLPHIALQSNLLKNTRVRTLELEKKAGRTIALVWRKGTGRQSEFHLLGDFIREQL